MSSYQEVPIAGRDTGAPRSLRKRIDLIARYLPAGPIRLLDAGCGAGEYVRALHAMEEVEVLGVEYMADKVAQAKADSQLRHLVEQGDLQALSFADQSFEVVLLNEVLEHVPDERRALQEIHRVLQPSGRLILFSPNRWFPFETHGVHLRWNGSPVPPYTPLVPWIPLPLGKRFLDYWARNYWQGELRQLVANQGFELLSTDYVWQTFENISGIQPALIRMAKPVLRFVANSLERTPGLRRFGVSQVLVLERS